MYLRLKKYSSLLVLFVFLFSYTEKGIHDIFHIGDVHCHAQNEKHFHTQEHHCYICDFEFSTYDNTSTLTYSAFISHSTELKYLALEQQTPVPSITSFLTRGPPALS